MSLGTLYVNASPRSILARDLVKYYDLDITIQEGSDDQFEKDFPLKSRPAFRGQKGFKLTECIAINTYLLKFVGEHKFLGKTEEENAEILKWLSFTNSDIFSASFGVIAPILGYTQYNKKGIDTSLEKLEKFLSVAETRLSNYTYLVSERVTLADLFAATLISLSFKLILSKEWRSNHVNIVRWFKTLIAHPILSPSFKDFEFAEEMIKYTPPKKEKKAKQPQQEKPKAKKVEAAPASDAAPAPAAEEKKPKHPLELLGKSKIPLDEWKRVYSNEDTRPTALPWFWENYDPAEWSLWKVDYKYNDELTLTFMSNNLVGGFFNRLSASTKYLFGCMVVYGENNNNGITGAFLVRGQDFKPAFDVAPDWESYDFTKLDATKPESKELINDLWAWDKPLIINGESREVADGKVFK